ncbi:MAG: choice-of-anchor tandem repeat GloVer-containing protein, partial [Chthoniobacterales bacterium]
MKLLPLLLSSICWLTCLHPGSPASAQTFTQLYSLTAAEGSPITGRILQASDGNFYGTAQQGGTNSVGTFFKLAADGTFTVLHSFGSVAGEGQYPNAGVIQAIDGNFYGTTGAPGGGTIYKMTPAGMLTTLYTLGTQSTDGRFPYAPLVQSADGTFYGVTYQGGPDDTGTIFKVTTNGTPGGTTFTTLHSFAAQAGGVNDEGANPYGPLIVGVDGNIYGTTYSGGANHHGTIFQITPAGAFTTLHVFSATEGECRGALVRDSSGVFYGTSSNQPQGSVFQFVTDGSMAGTAVTTLYSFTGGSDGGGFVAGVVINSDGDLYGVTLLNGANGNGTLFRLTPGGPLTTLHAFGAGSEEAQPHAGVIIGSDGNVYGTTKSTIFKLQPSSAVPPAPVHGGLSDTVFAVRKLPPATSGGDSVLHFSARQSGTPEGLKVRVQVNNVPDNERNDWVDLNNGSGGYLTLDKTTGKFVLSASNYPETSVIYFRA